MGRGRIYDGDEKERHMQAVREYNKVNTIQLSLKFNLRTDMDIIERLDEEESKAAYIKRLIREDMNK